MSDAKDKDTSELSRTERLEIMQKVGERQKLEQQTGRPVVVDSDESADDLDYRKTPAEAVQDMMDKEAEKREDEADESDESEEEEQEDGEEDEVDVSGTGAGKAPEDGEQMTQADRTRKIMEERMKVSRDDLAAREEAGTDTVLPEIDDETGLSEQGKKK